MRKLWKMFHPRFSKKMTVGDRVRHLDTGLLGTVTGVAKISGRIPALNVRFDNGQEASLVPTETFVKIDRLPLWYGAWATTR